MRLDKEDFDWAVKEGIITTEQADLLWETFSLRKLGEEETSERPKFNFANFAYYFGALIVISAMGWCMTVAWEVFGGAGIFFIAAIYALCFAFTGKNLYFKQNLKVAGGLLFTMAVCMTPLAIYGLQRWTGFWAQGEPGMYRDFHFWIRGSWFFMEMGTIIAALIALRFVKFPFLTAPIAFSLWYMSMDITPLIFGRDFNGNEKATVSLWFGIVSILIAYFVDLRTRGNERDFAFWLYLFGLMTFWGSLPFVRQEFSWHLYGLINLFLMFLSVFLKRRVFMVFGAIGIFSYLCYLSYQVFADSLLFPFALTAIGIMIIYVGVLYQRHYRNLELYLDSIIPPEFKYLIPQERRNRQ